MALDDEGRSSSEDGHSADGHSADEGHAADEDQYVDNGHSTDEENAADERDSPSQDSSKIDKKQRRARDGTGTPGNARQQSNDDKTALSIENTASDEVDEESAHCSISHKRGKTGVLYVSRIPPGMEPSTLRSLLNQVGPTGRLWLRPATSNGNAPETVRGAGGKHGKHGKHGKQRKQTRRQTTFRDGWVEFLARRHAKRAVTYLNGRPMTAARRKGRFANDLWTIRYLPRFTWDDLGREVFGNAREKVLQVREDIASARRERAWVEERLDIRKRVVRKRGQKGVDSDADGVVRRFRQRNVFEDEDERRAREAAERVDQDVQAGVKRKIDDDLVAKLFKKRRVSGEAASS